MENNDRGRIGEGLCGALCGSSAARPDRESFDLFQRAVRRGRPDCFAVDRRDVLCRGPDVGDRHVNRVDARRHTVDGRAVRRAGGDRICGTPQADRRSDGQDVRQNGV